MEISRDLDAFDQITTATLKILMKDSIQTMTTLATYPKELLLLIAGNLAPADVACFHLANKHIHSILRRLDFRCDLMEGADDSQDDLLSVRRERRSLMKRLRGSIPEEFDYCSICTKYKRYDEDWVQKRVSIGSREDTIIDTCSDCSMSPEFENTRWYTPVSEGLWPNKSKGRYLAGYRGR